MTMLIEKDTNCWLREYWTDKASPLGEFLASHNIQFQYTTIWLTAGNRKFILCDGAVVEFKEFRKFSVVTDEELLFQVLHITANLHCQMVK